jgi:uncharacterized protein YcbX
VERPHGVLSAARLLSLHLYPLKSAGGIQVAQARVDETGLTHDRRWMVVDSRGRFLTQRSHPRMALLRTALSERALRVSGPRTDPLELPLSAPQPADPGSPELIPVWDKDRDAVSCGPEAAAWMSAFLGTDCRVVRSVSPPGTSGLGPRGTVRAGFADGWPALVISTASLDDLNGRLPGPLPMNRFRPNLVVDGIGPYGEDRWRRVRVGDVGIVGRKPCFRCAITTTDQDTGERGVEPLRTLATYRRAPGGDVAFGMNVGFESAGVLRVGDAVNVEETDGSGI